MLILIIIFSVIIMTILVVIIILIILIFIILIVIIIMRMIGYAGATPGKEIKQTHRLQLAREGLRFTNNYQICQE